MAISEAVLKDTVLMLIADQNRKGGLLGRKLEPVVVDPASDWDLSAEKARELLVEEKVAVVFGCWTSACRKAVLPVFEQLNGLLFYPVQYEGEESSRNVFYTGAAPNQQAIPAVQYLMSKEGGEIRRWVLVGTDYIYPRTSNRIVEAYLAAKGVQPNDIMTIYTPFGQSDWREIVGKIKAFGSAGPKTAVISTINGDANTHFYRELAAQSVDAATIPVMALSVGDRELLGLDVKLLTGHLAAWNYFQSVKSPENEAFVKMWERIYREPKGTHQRSDGGHVYRLQNVGAGCCPSRYDRCQCGSPSHVSAEDKGAERLRGGDEHQSPPVQAGHDWQGRCFRDV